MIAFVFGLFYINHQFQCRHIIVHLLKICMQMQIYVSLLFIVCLLPFHALTIQPIIIIFLWTLSDVQKTMKGYLGLKKVVAEGSKQHLVPLILKAHFSYLRLFTPFRLCDLLMWQLFVHLVSIIVPLNFSVYIRIFIIEFCNESLEQMNFVFKSDINHTILWQFVFNLI